MGRSLFSRDKDLLAEAAKRLRGGIQFSTVAFAKQTEVSTSRRHSDLEIIAPKATPEAVVVNLSRC